MQLSPLRRPEQLVLTLIPNSLYATLVLVQTFFDFHSKSLKFSPNLKSLKALNSDRFWTEVLRSEKYVGSTISAHSRRYRPPQNSILVQRAIRYESD